jgi:DNA-binding MarR family transcriptional regulator
VSRGRRAALDRVLQAQRALASQTVGWYQAVAGRLGIHATDVQAMNLLAGGPLTAGELGAATNLTTASVTKLIDRLEQRGFARRVRDPGDRRRVYVELVDEVTEREVMPLYDELTKVAERQHKRYDDEQLALIEGFLNDAEELLRSEVERLRG